MANQGTPKSRGRQPDANSMSGKIRELLQTTDMTVGEIAAKLGCTPALAYNVKARMANGGQKRRGPGRPPKITTVAKAAAPQSGGLEGIFAAVQKAERERTQLRAVLTKIQAVIADVLE